NALLNKMQGLLPLANITEVREAPLAVVGAAPRSGLFAFDKFSSAPFIMDAVRNDVGVNGGGGDSRRRIFLVPRAQGHRLNMTGTSVTSIDMSVAGMRQQLSVARGSAGISAHGTIEGTRPPLEFLGIGA